MAKPGEPQGSSNPFDASFETLETTATIPRDNPRQRLVVRRVREKKTGAHFADVRVFIPNINNPGATKHGLMIGVDVIGPLIEGLVAVHSLWAEAGVVQRSDDA